ncbi:MAG: alcohol dehydrogenase catalytic domain-containing protein, partial [Actinomycetota bacterium]|nr:alcohol dehydrogenase catalytic domain-containing protein [Actinomycetota bacterium]
KTSICASDLHLLSGKTPGMRAGSVIGHEFVGTVVEGGDAVGLAEGMRVLGSFLIACGRCGPCAAGRFNHCRERRALGLGELTGDLDGAQAEFVRVPYADVNLRPIPEAEVALTDEQALFSGDILPTGFYAAALARLAPEEVVAVIGAGPIGLCCALAARLAGPRVLIFDAEPRRVDFAKVLGFEAFDVSAQSVEAVTQSVTEGAGVDVAMDAVGSIDAFRSAMRCVRDGGRVVVVGVYGAERYGLSMGMTWIRGLELTFTGMANVHAHWGHALDATAEGAVDPAQLITHRLALDSAVEGYELFGSRAAMKVVLTP